MRGRISSTIGGLIQIPMENGEKGLDDIFEERNASVFSVECIKPEETKRYGVVSGREVSKGIMLVDNLVEKPETAHAPSLLGIQGRYVFTSDIFNHLKKTKTSRIVINNSELIKNNFYMIMFFR